MNTNQDKALTVEVGEANFGPEVSGSKQLILVAFWAPWSRPCQILDSALEEVAAACAGRVKVVKINADNNPDLSLVLGIQSIPTLLYFADGSLRARIVGTASKEVILSNLQPVFHGGDSTSFTPNANKENEHRNL